MLEKDTMPTVERMPMIAMTTRSSMMVKALLVVVFMGSIVAEFYGIIQYYCTYSLHLGQLRLVE